VTRAAVAAALLGIAAGSGSASAAEGETRRVEFAPGIEACDLRERPRLRILVLGDSGTGAANQLEVGRRMAEECRREGGCDLALALGDNVYGGALAPPREEGGRLVFDPAFDERFERPYAPLGALDFWLVTGNHDWASSKSAEMQIAYSRHSSRWRMPAHDYAVPLLPDWIRIYGLDTTRLLSGGDPAQVDRAREWLCAGPGWRILFGHHPVYSSGWHGNAAGECPKAKKPLLEPLIERCGVQFYLSGHDHDQEHLSAPRFEQIVQGAAAKLRKLEKIAERPPGIEQVAAAAEFGFALLDVTPERIELRFYGYSDRTPYRNWHCRSFALADFDDRERRARDCALEPPD
jgi:acid phosphatase